MSEEHVKKPVTTTKENPRKKGSWVQNQVHSKFKVSKRIDISGLVLLFVPSLTFNKSIKK
jgi:hypothetical protein